MDAIEILASFQFVISNGFGELDPSTEKCNPRNSSRWLGRGAARLRVLTWTRCPFAATQWRLGVISSVNEVFGALQEGEIILHD